MGVSRTAVWQHVRTLADLGLQVRAVRGSGYRLERALDLLDAQRIEAGLDIPARQRLRGLEILFATDSTNQRLLDQAAGGDIHARACMAEFQTSGRGRRGRRWQAPLGSGICLSLGWRFDAPATTLGGLSLAVGVAAHRALRTIGAAEVLLKWPNDLVWRGRKLAGVLVEMRAEMGGPCTAVIGVGLNTALPQAMLAAFEPACVDLRTILGDEAPRNRVAAALLGEMTAALARFESNGFGDFIDEWRQYDLARGRPIDLHLPTETVRGRAVDVDHAGALVVDVRGGQGLRRFHSGEVSVRVGVSKERREPLARGAAQVRRAGPGQA